MYTVYNITTIVCHFIIHRRLSEFNHAVVVTNVPLKDNQLFEVEVTRLTDRWAGSVEVGLTTHAPDKLEFPPTMTNMTSGTWMISGKGVIRNRSNIKRNLSFDLDSLTVSTHSIYTVPYSFNGCYLRSPMYVITAMQS